MPSDDLYAVLGVDRVASGDAVKKAYYKLASQIHPDKVPDEEKAEATKKFQRVSFAYSVLSDENKRRVYDKTGRADGEEDALDEEMLSVWTELFKTVFPPLTPKDISDFETKYKGSADEREDVKKAYEEHGTMDGILSDVPLSTTADEDRFREIIREMIEAGEVTERKKWEASNTTKQIKLRRKREAKEEKQAAEATTGEEQNALAVLRSEIQSKRGLFEGILAKMEEKYGDSQPPAKRRRKGKAGHK
eukprot:TRINITY_DN32865_c0_g1_i1.p1 TRINITY_DN32865_c0_g1~~TRINITY_DN32865_c0_g1_i1.p1  ORF type:complete len:248 (+),score=67.90 TRINITY_DN32865_c0_g1_i1:43-786(+)